MYQLPAIVIAWVVFILVCVEYAPRIERELTPMRAAWTALEGGTHP